MILNFKKIFLAFLIILFNYQAFADPKMVLGLDVYNNKAHCGTCHTLQAGCSTGQIWPDLDQLNPLMPQVMAAINNRIGVMPALEGMLSYEENVAVSYFVSASTNQQ